MRGKERITNEGNTKAENRRKSDNQYNEIMTLRSQIIGVGHREEAGKAEGQNKQSEN